MLLMMKVTEDDHAVLISEKQTDDEKPPNISSWSSYEPESLGYVN